MFCLHIKNYNGYINFQQPKECHESWWLNFYNLLIILSINIHYLAHFLKFKMSIEIKCNQSTTIFTILNSYSSFISASKYDY